MLWWRREKVNKEIKAASSHRTYEVFFKFKKKNVFNENAWLFRIPEAVLGMHSEPKRYTA